MNCYRFIMSSLFCLTFFSSAAAVDLQHGIHGMRWGAPISEHSQLKKIRETDRISYYVNPEMIYRASNQPVTAVIYGFYEDRLFAVFIKLHTPDQFNNLKRHFSAKYGKPKSEFNPQNRQSVYRWKDGDIKIKLKMIEPNREFKLGMYYSPLAERLNDEQFENIPDDVFSPSPSESGRTVNSAPLLDK
jgi:hypothetical protein